MKKLIVLLFSFGAISSFANQSYFQVKSYFPRKMGTYNNGKFINKMTLRDTLGKTCSMQSGLVLGHYFSEQGLIIRVSEVSREGSVGEILSSNTTYTISALTQNILVKCNFRASIDEMFYNLGISAQKIEDFKDFDLYSDVKNLVWEDFEEDLNINLARYLIAYYGVREAVAARINGYSFSSGDDKVMDSWLNKLSPSQKFLVRKIEESKK